MWDLLQRPILERLVFFSSSWDGEYHNCLRGNGSPCLSAGIGLPSLGWMGEPGIFDWETYLRGASKVTGDAW